MGVLYIVVVVGCVLCDVVEVFDWLCVEGLLVMFV